MLKKQLRTCIEISRFLSIVPLLCLEKSPLMYPRTVSYSFIKTVNKFKPTSKNNN